MMSKSSKLTSEKTSKHILMQLESRPKEIQNDRSRSNLPEADL